MGDFSLKLTLSMVVYLLFAGTFIFFYVGTQGGAQDGYNTNVQFVEQAEFVVSNGTLTEDSNWMSEGTGTLSFLLDFLIFGISGLNNWIELFLVHIPKILLVIGIVITVADASDWI